MISSWRRVPEATSASAAVSRRFCVASAAAVVAATLVSKVPTAADAEVSNPAAMIASVAASSASADAFVASRWLAAHWEVAAKVASAVVTATSYLLVAEADVASNPKVAESTFDL